MSVSGGLNRLKSILLYGDTRVFEVCMACIVVAVGLGAGLQPAFFSDPVFAQLHASVHESLLGIAFLAVGMVWGMGLYLGRPRVTRRAAFATALLWGALAGIAASVAPFTYVTFQLAGNAVFCLWMDVRWRLPRFRARMLCRA